MNGGCNGGGGEHLDVVARGVASEVDGCHVDVLQSVERAKCDLRLKANAKHTI